MPNIVQHLLRIAGHVPLPGLHRLVWRFQTTWSDAQSSDFEVGFAGLRYRGTLDDWIDRNVFFFGSYAQVELDFLSSAARIVGANGKQVAYFDVGANVGQHALFMSKRVANVIAFEPSASVRGRFEANIALNELKNVRVFAVALGDTDGEGTLGSGFAGNSGSRSLTWTLDSAKEESVAIRRGDTLFNEEKLPRIDILKLDVEGFEKRVLHGLRETLTRDRPIVLMELVGSSEKSGFKDEAELHETLYPDHKLFTLSGKQNARLVPFNWNEEALVCLPKESVESFVKKF